MYNNNKPQNPNSYIVFDFETSGLDPNKVAVTEIAMIVIKGDEFLEEIGRYEALIKPYNPKLQYEEKALKITNISIDKLHDEGKDFKEVVENVLELMISANCYKEKSPGLKPILVGHNVQFDIAFLQAMMNEYYKDQKTSGDKRLQELLHGRESLYGNFTPTYIDTWVLGKMWFGGDIELPNYKLGTIVEKAGIEIYEAHRAMNDVVATGEFLRACIRSMKGGYDFVQENNSRITKSKRENFLFPI